MRQLKNHGPAKGHILHLGAKAILLTSAFLLLNATAFAETPQPAPADATSTIKALQNTPGHSGLTPEFIASAKQKFALSQSSDTSTEFGQPAAGALAQLPAQPSLINPTPLARAALDQGAALYAASPLIKTATAATGAPVATVCPGTYEKSTEAANAVLGNAFAAINKRDVASLQTQLPSLTAAFSTVPLKPLAPEICNDHTNVYTTAQFAKLSALKEAGVPNGTPANLPLVKQPDLPYTLLSFAIGWTKYELQDYDGAFLALAKGMIVDPSNAFLANEYIASLFALKRFTDVVGFADTFLSSNYTLTDDERSQLFASHGWALVSLGYGDAAEKSFMIALVYNGANKTAQEGYTFIRNAKAKAGAS